jgi:hypothetical protein
MSFAVEPERIWNSSCPLHVRHTIDGGILPSPRHVGQLWMRPRPRNRLVFSRYGAREAWFGPSTLSPMSVYCPASRTFAIASKETGIHAPLNSANCIVIWMFLIHTEGFLAGVPSIRRMQNVLASTQISPSNSVLALPLWIISKTYSRTTPKFSRRRKTSRSSCD